jgi:hypothetical protein
MVTQELLQRCVLTRPIGGDPSVRCDYHRSAGTGTDTHIVDAPLGDWVAADPTSGRITGTWGYYTMISKLATIAHLTGHTADADKYRALAVDIKAAFNAHFYNTQLHRYTTDGNVGTTGATQTAQALALDAGLAPEGERESILNGLVELTAYRALVIQPKVVGDLTSVKGSYHTPQGVVRAEWARTAGRFTLTVVVPTNTTAEIWVPTQGGRVVLTPNRAEFLRTEGDYAVYRVGSGSFTFATATRPN